MTTAYAQRSPQIRHAYASGPQLRLVTSAPPQGPEATKMRENLLAISLGTMARGQGAESAKLKDAVRDLAESIEAFNGVLHNRDEIPYNHVPAKPAFSVQATYKFIGKLRPRLLPLDE
jgi:hypothetical protein